MSMRARLQTAALLLVITAAPALEAQSTLSSRQLADASIAIVAGQVESMTISRDPITHDIYTDVSLAVSEVFAGAIESPSIVVKQLGGELDDEGIFVPGQARFVRGEEVLLYLARRPRDHSLYTAALGQSKWNIEISATTGERLAVRRHEDGSIDARPLSTLRSEIGGRAADAVAVSARNVTPIEAPRDALPFVLNDPLIRWPTPVVPVRTSAGAQPGLSGGGLAEIGAALAQWNAAGSGLTLMVDGVSQTGPCTTERGVIRIKFNDPCGELGEASMAYSMYRYSIAPTQTISGRVYYPITSAEVITSASPNWRWALVLPSCFQSAVAHELGHALGIQHSSDPSALMYRDVICVNGVRAIAADDAAAMQTIYPSASGPATPGSATVIASLATAGLLGVSWTLSPGAPPTAHRLEFFSNGALVASLTGGAATTATIPVPSGTAGTFSVRVTALSGSTAGTPSPQFPFTIGGGGGAATCSSPPVPPAARGSVVGGTASVSWFAVPGATSYVISAGTAPGAANLLPPTNLGQQTIAGATGLPSGFAAWVRVTAVNACGQSAPADLYLF